jgi:diguanylate cyclase (GGDEF)-like protein/PAS domain S-box-containing protein
MTTVFLFNIAISLALGAALLAAWWRDRTQAFLRMVGLAFLVHAGLPIGFLVMSAGGEPARLAGLTLLVALAMLSIGLLALGVAYLAHRPPSHARLPAAFAGLLLVGVLLVPLGSSAALGSVAALHLGIGLLAAWWLWPLGRAERFSALLLIALSLNQFQIVLIGAEAVARQSMLGAVLRLLLGLALLHAAVRRSAQESQRAHDRLVRLTEHSHQGVAVVRGEHLLYANPALLRIYGLNSLAEVNTLWRDATMPAAERASARERHQQLVAGELAQVSWSGQRYRFDGTPIRLRFTAWRIDWDGHPAEQVVVTDETAQHDATAALLHQATHDELTGAPNRSALQARLRELCAARAGFALLLLDVDRFALFNEAHGPSVGDAVLRALAAALVGALQGRAEVMRLGEDEFALLAPAAAPDRAAQQVAQAVRELLAQPLTLPGHEFFLDASIGVALHPAHGRDPEALLRAANAAMHEAKHTPGTSLQFAEERFERGSGVTLLAEQALRGGLKNEEFSLVYQPKVDGRSGVLLGFEALARWDRPGIGRVSPLEFIPAAERTGLIGALGRLILAQACSQTATWRAEFGHCVPVAVNVSPLELLDPGFPDEVERTLRRHGVPPELLTLEITESAAVAHMEQARGRIAALRALGIEVALDDFGIGFSSLNMLRSLPLHAVKIDRTLIEPMPAPDATAVVKAICDIAAALELEVVAEGVESRAQAEAALAAGCRVMQGYLHARPLAPEEAGRWLARSVPARVRALRP